MQPGPFEALSETLMTPAKSGVYLAKNELLLLARTSEASLRFNERKRMLVDIFRSAQTGDELVAMMDRLIAFTKESLARYEELATEYPASAATWRPWIDKAKRTVLLLEETKQEIRL